MSEKMRNCKACGQQIAASAKMCPHCGAKVKKALPIWVVVAVVVVIIAVASSTGNDEPKRVDGNTNTQTEASGAVSNDATGSTENDTPVKEEKNVFKTGETAELKDVAVSLVGVTESTGSQFNTPQDGKVFVLCEFEITNNSSAEIVVSSMMSFNAYCDDYACTYSLSALMEKGEKNQLDGTVAAGKKMNGVIGYEVPAEWKELEVRFTPNFWNGKEIVFVAANN